MNLNKSNPFWHEAAQSGVMLKERNDFEQFSVFFKLCTIIGLSAINKNIVYLE